MYAALAVQVSLSSRSNEMNSTFHYEGHFHVPNIKRQVEKQMKTIQTVCVVAKFMNVKSV